MLNLEKHPYKVNHMTTYEGDEDPWNHWFIWETMWYVNDITEKSRPMAQFVGYLQKRTLTWYVWISPKEISTSKIWWRLCRSPIDRRLEEKNEVVQKFCSWAFHKKFQPMVYNLYDKYSCRLRDERRKYVWIVHTKYFLWNMPRYWIACHEIFSFWYEKCEAQIVWYLWIKYT